MGVVHPIERINTGTGELFGDGEHILYVNGSYEGKDPIGILMHDFRCSDPDEMLDDMLAAKTRYFKETEEGVEYMCKAIEDMRNETRKEEHFFTVLENLKNVMDTFHVSTDKAMDALKIPIEERDRYLSRL